MPTAKNDNATQSQEPKPALDENALDAAPLSNEKKSDAPLEEASEKSGLRASDIYNYGGPKAYAQAMKKLEIDPSYPPLLQAILEAIQKAAEISLAYAEKRKNEKLEADPNFQLMKDLKETFDDLKEKFEENPDLFKNKDDKKKFDAIKEELDELNKEFKKDNPKPDPERIKQLKQDLNDLQIDLDKKIEQKVQEVASNEAEQAPAAVLPPMTAMGDTSANANNTEVASSSELPSGVREAGSAEQPEQEPTEQPEQEPTEHPR